MDWRINLHFLLRFGGAGVSFTSDFMIIFSPFFVPSPNWVRWAFRADSSLRTGSKGKERELLDSSEYPWGTLFRTELAVQTIEEPQPV